VLAGGFGTRLKSVVSEVPKPLAPVCGKPFLVHLIENLVSQGGKDFVLLLHYEAELIMLVITEFLERNKLYGITIRSIVEDMPLGTGGSIMNAVDTLNINKSFLVINADTWLGDGLEQLSISSPNTIAAVKVKDCSRYGALMLKNSKIEKFLEKNLSYSGGYINAGLYHLSPNIFKGFGHSANFSLENDVFPKVVKNGILSAIKINTHFIDIGLPEDYSRFCKWIKSGKKIEL